VFAEEKGRAEAPKDKMWPLGDLLSFFMVNIRERKVINRALYTKNREIIMQY